MLEPKPTPLAKVELSYEDGYRQIWEGDAAIAWMSSIDSVLGLHQARGYSVSIPEPTKVIHGEAPAQTTPTQDDPDAT